MKVEMCMFSGYKIHPGHGKLYTRIDGKSFFYLGRKSASLYLQRKNPRKIAWTVLYRRKHKKNIEHETSKRRVRKVAKTGRAIANLTQEDVMKRRNEKPDFRKVQREQAIKAAKEKAKTARNRAKAAAKAAGGPKQGKAQIKSTKAQGRGKR
eukprot:m.428960 g.428960  ORF g.428960 m.428960 type:complete len:152 (-) comp16919_c0_seq1:44-499(-)